MPIEAPVNYIEDLNETWPAGPEDSGDGDNHLVNIKVAVKGSFPNLGQAPVTKTASEINDLATKTGTETLEAKTINNGTFTGTQEGFVGDVTGNLTGNAATATDAINAVNVTGSGVADFNTTLTRPSAVGTFIATTAGFTVPPGVYNLLTPLALNTLFLEIFVGANWYAIEEAAPGVRLLATITSDGLNVRLRTSSGTDNVQYKQMYS